MKRFQPLVQRFELPDLSYARKVSTSVANLVGRLQPKTRSSKATRSYLISALAIATLTSAIGHRFYNAPKLDTGRAAPQTIYAPRTATVEDRRATEEKQRAARKSSISVLALDQGATQQIRDNLQRHLDQGDELRRLAGPFPFTKTATLSVGTQTYLRQTSEEEWQTLLNVVDPTGSFLGASTRTRTKLSDLSNDTQRRAATELLAQPRTPDSRNYIALLETISQARSQYASTLTLLTPGSPDEKTVYDKTLLDISAADWQQVKARLPQLVERIVAQGIPPGLTEAILENAVRLHVKGFVPPGTESLSVKVLLLSLQPNLVHDEEQTRLRAEHAAQLVEPEMISIREGEIIVRAGEEITTAKFALLDEFGLSRRGIDWVGLIGFGILVSGAVVAFWFIERRFHPTMRRRDRVLVWLLSLSAPLVIVLQVPSTNLPAIGLLVGSFYGSPIGIAVTGLLAVLLPFGLQLPWSQLLSSTGAGLLGGWMAGRLRSREELALLGIGVGLLQGSLYLVLNVASGMVWYTLLGSAALHALIGLAWCIVAIGVSPYLEQVFDLVTTIRLVELANPNCYLLKQLAAKTPGTFQHTLFVATLAEAAARALGCNVELVRTGTLYHDIGKMHDPLGFIENQMGGPNKHDLIDDPYKSAEIIKKHVTEGLVMARKCRLPKAVQAFIPEHQGTMLIAYFYHQAQQRAKQTPNPDGTLPEVCESDFRYDGPIPQTRETGIVMLADSCEAALRSLKEATYDEALAMINKILRARWQDNQLINSGLTREDMSKIATVFVEVWQQFNHQRIAYPKLGGNAQPVLQAEQSPTAVK
ncbi:HDIG domain-containing protein [Leptothermofonsia sichuanensis E412]|uniref:HD family phosphohydrolase n=1 Tax=Leptothermofonsia sichuanensis TaxID=2917832 RepID=UPI001CA6049B|nr:HDIG domain-containing metalloprotein [Leptothermofonsia sichuanensis]QZZ19676.1 HDIG domain-containing protein [Leptothermofonsia sichuanensis E412]